MQQLNFYVNNGLVPPPDNWRDFQAELSFENGSPEGTINATQLVWKGENAVRLNQWFNAGLISGGVGIFEGVPLQVKICETQEVVFDGIIDLSDPETVWNCDIVTAKIRDKRMDMITQLFESISFAYLATPVSDGGPGVINPKATQDGGDYVCIPYQRSDIPDYIQFFSMALAIWNIAQITYDILNKMVALITGTAVGLAVPVFGTVAGIMGMLELIGYILYIIAMILVVIMLLKAAFNYLISPVLSKFGMYAHTLMEKVCAYFNIGFASTILQTDPFNRLVIMPAKQAWPDSNETFTSTVMNHIIGVGTQGQRMEYDDYVNLANGGMAYGYYDGTAADFVRSMEDVFNAKAKIIFDSLGNPVMHFERWDYIYNVANFQLPNISDQAPFKQSYSTNASAIPSNYEVKFALDTSDTNTYNDYDGNSCFCTTRPIQVNVLRNVVLQNYTDKTLMFAHATRKQHDTAVEMAFLPVYQAGASLYNNFLTYVYDPIIDVRNAVAKLIDLPEILKPDHVPSTPSWASSGHMLLSNNVTGSPKMFIADPVPVQTTNFFDFHSHSVLGVNIDPSNKTILGAKSLFKNFHFSNIALTKNPGSPYTTSAAGTEYFNQYIEFKDQEIPLCCADYDAIKNNNIIKTYDGKFARVDSLKWNIFKGTATIDYRINQKYTNNLQTTFVIDGATTVASL